MFTQGEAVFGAEALLRKMSYLIAKARAARAPVIYVRNNGGFNDPDLYIHPAVSPIAGEAIIQKHTPDAFFETGLRWELELRQVKRLIIMGLQTEFCIDATSHRAFALGYELILVKDGHSTFDTPEQSAVEIIARYNREWGAFANLVEAKQVHFDFPQPS
ncbi:MAG: cysteine hydrolase [Anaerolineae bacterium]|nr:cysteine hydrolase [Anaerolineae bacterium]